MEGLDFNKLHNNILEKPEAERITEYAQKVIKISSLKEAEVLIRDIIITEKRASLLMESKLASERRVDIGRIYKMFQEYEKYSLLKIKNSDNKEEEIKNLIKKNKNSFKEGENIFFVEAFKNNPNAVVVYLDSNINVEDIEIYFTPDNDLQERFKRKYEFITPDKIKK